MSVIERIVLRLAREPLGPYYGGPEVACGPTVRITEQGLELRSATEGAHTIAWASIHGWSRRRHLIVVDLGPRTPLASRCIQIWPR